MKNNTYVALVIIAVMIFTSLSKAQIDSTVALCASKISLPFISDGQQYQALVNKEETAEFYSTFYGGNIYRIVGYSGLSEGNLIFSIYDENRNLLFTNADYGNAPYWDFKFTSTVNCIIEAKLDSKNLTSGIIVMFIGFKQ